LYSNVALDFIRHYWKKHKADPTDKEIRAGAKTYVSDVNALNIHAHSKQIIIDSLLENIKTYRSSLGKVQNTHAPFKHKQYKPITFTNGYGWKVRDNKLVLSLGRNEAKLIIPMPKFAKKVPIENWATVQLCWDRFNREWNLNIAYKIPKGESLDKNNTLAIDAGIINSSTCAVKTDNGFDCYVISGRHARAIHHRRNKKTSELSQKMARCKKGSRKWKKYRKAQKQAYGKANNALRNFNHQSSRKVADIAKLYDTGNIVIGSLDKIADNTKAKRNANKDHRRRLSNWSRGKQEQYLAEKTGVRLSKIDESNTSSICLMCKSTNRSKGQQYRCLNCGFTAHRDVVGAINIFSIAQYGEITPMIDKESKLNVIYLRTTPLCKRSNAGNPANVAEKKPVCASSNRRQTW
jgi:IS605 OrfB family transposase